MQKIVFLDRDDTLVHDPGYLSDPKKVEIKNNVVKGLKKLLKNGYKFIVITNQSGVGRGYFKKNKVYKVNRKINYILNNKGINIEDFYFCPHSPDENCSCRKPKPGLFEKVKKDYSINIKQSYMIGDKCSDINFGKNVGLKTILLTSKANKKFGCKPDYVCRGLEEASSWIIKNEKV